MATSAPTAAMSPVGFGSSLFGWLRSWRSPRTAKVPMLNPMTVATGEWRWAMSGTISPATAANTTPAAMCWTALRSLALGRQRVVAAAPTTASRNGMIP